MQKAIGERFAGIRHLRNGRGRRTTTTTRRMGDDADVDDYQIRRPALPHAPTPLRRYAPTPSRAPLPSTPMRAAVTTALAGVDKKTTNAGVSVGRQVQVWSDRSSG
jgi:hypothetical protein